MPVGGLHTELFYAITPTLPVGGLHTELFYAITPTLFRHSAIPTCDYYVYSYFICYCSNETHTNLLVALDII